MGRPASGNESDLSGAGVAATTRAFSIATLDWDGDVMVAVGGEIDIHTAPALERELALPDVCRARTVLVDLERVSFVDLSGLRPLLAFATARRDAPVAISGGSRPVQALLRLSGLRDQFTVVAPPEASAP